MYYFSNQSILGTILIIITNHRFTSHVVCWSLFPGHQLITASYIIIITPHPSIHQQIGIHNLHGEAKRDGMDNTIVTLNIDGVVTEWAKGLLSNNGIIHKVLPHGIPVL